MIVRVNDCVVLNSLNCKYCLSVIFTEICFYFPVILGQLPLLCCAGGFMDGFWPVASYHTATTDIGANVHGGGD